MKLISSVTVICLLAIATMAQEKPVAITAEGHHQLVLENEYTRVFHVVVPSKQSTLMHAHELDYVSVQIGAADFTNEKVGSAPAEVKLDDGAVKFAKGGFAHKITILSDAPFENLTIEVKKPSTKAICGASWPGVLAESPKACESERATGVIGEASNVRTDAVEVHTYFVAGSGTNFAVHDEENPRLLVALTKLSCRCGGAKALEMMRGDVTWVPKGTLATLSKAGAEDPKWVTVAFK